MATYELPYAEKHLAELFEEACSGEDVIIVRQDGRRCQLLPVADAKEESPIPAFEIPLAAEVALTPA